jgi:hypothetical protein
LAPALDVIPVGRRTIKIVLSLFGKVMLPVKRHADVPVNETLLFPLIREVVFKTGGEV